MSDAIKYLHFNNTYIKKEDSKKFRRKYASRTVAAKAAPAADILALAHNYAGSTQEFVYGLLVGVTVLSIDDVYDRKLGRQFATEKMTSVELTINSIVTNKTHIFVHFKTYKGVDLSLRLNKNTGFSTVVGNFMGD
jgi:hypothetical protein